MDALAQRPMKDVASCEKLRGGASNLRSADVRMGQPVSGNTESFRFAGKKTRRSETSKYPEEQKEQSIPPVAASEKGTA